MTVSIALAALLAGAPLDLALQEPAPPLQVYRLNLAVDIPVTVAGAAAALARTFMKDKFARVSCSAAQPCNTAGLNFLDRGTVSNTSSHTANVVSDVTTAVALGLPPFLDLFDVGWSKAFGEDLMVFAETIAVNTTVQQVANFAVARPRPRTYANDPAYLNTSEGYLSFYSGHVASVMSALSAASYTLRLRYGEQVWPWIITGAVGGSVALERVLAGSHFPTDCAAGAVAGVAIGIVVPWLHARTRVQRLSILPAEGGRGFALAGAF
jgi:membrane-associated phospholipid phosphatase